MDPGARRQSTYRFQWDLRPRRPVSGFVVISVLQRRRGAHPFNPDPQRSEKSNTPCTINSYASWCAIQQGAAASTVELHFAHGDQPIFKWVKIGPAQDDPKSIVMRSVPYDEKWMLHRYGDNYSAVIEVGGYGNTICFGPGARKPYPQGCGKP